MSTTLLRTKLHIPPARPNLVSRPRLIERLERGLNTGSKLSLISAPAGYGKTTLVSTWLHSTDLRSSWLSLDESDNDPARFFNHLLACLQTVNAQVGREMRSLLEAPHLPPAEDLVSVLINDLATAEQSFVLVLDDYHAIDDLYLHDAVEFLLKRQPAQMHLVIVTRHDPPLALSRLRGRGQLTEIRQDDLRFTEQEAAAFLEQSMGLELTAVEIEALEERTEGWIAGLQLAGLSMQGQDPAYSAQFIEDFSGRHHFVLDYLTDEVLKRQPKPIQVFLLQTSILKQMCGPLCDAVVGQERKEGSGKQLLAQLEAANLFVVPLDEEREWYRYHHLFADLLQARLQELRPHEIAGLHRRAAAWFMENGLSAQAVDHALATRDYPLAAEVIEKATRELSTWSRADVGNLLRWLNALPEEVARTRPWLRLFISRAYFATGQWETAERILEELEAWLQNHPTYLEAELIGRLVEADRASAAVFRGDVHQAMAYSERVRHTIAEDDLVGRIRMTSILGLACFRAGDVSRASQAFAEAIEISETAGMAFVAVPFLCNLVEVLIVQGKLRQAAQTCERALRLGTVKGQRIAPAGFVGLELGKILYEQNKLEAAERNLLEGLHALSSAGMAEGFGNMYAVLAQVKQAQGDERAAREAIQRAILNVRAIKTPRLSIQASAYQARIWLAQGDLDAAARWAEEYGQIGETEYLRDFEDLTLARVMLAHGQYVQALALLDSLLSPAESAGRLGRVVEIQALRALALGAQGNEDGALRSLGQALRLAEPEGYVRTFVDEGQLMAKLLHRAVSQGLALEYIGRLLTAIEGFQATALPETRLQPLPEPLTDRELEVLHLLSAGLTNPEIAHRLTIALPTVKSHTRNLYGKLGAHSRDEAVSHARALGILP